MNNVRRKFYDFKKYVIVSLSLSSVNAFFSPDLRLGSWRTHFHIFRLGGLGEKWGEARSRGKNVTLQESAYV